MNTANDYLVFTSLFSFSFYMIISSFKHLKEEIKQLSFEKIETMNRGTQTDMISHITVINTGVSTDRDPSIRSNFTCISSDDKFKKLFKF